MRLSSLPLVAALIFTLAACVSPQRKADQSGDLLSVAPIIPMPSAPLQIDRPLQRIAFGSCLRQHDDQSIWQTIASVEPNLFLMLGDNVYGDLDSNDASMPELRDAYRQLAMRVEFANFRRQVPLLTVWDDHDFGLNDAGGDFAFKHGTQDLFAEAWALPGDDPRRTRDGVYHSQIIGRPGQRVQVILLDTRFFRDALKPTDERGAPGKERYLPDDDPGKTMLGAEQYAWLLAELQKPADLRLIASSIQVIADGHGWEGWRLLPRERRRLYDTIQSAGADNVLLLSGDRHAGALYRHDGALTYPLFEATSSSLNAPASKWRSERGETRMEAGPNRLGPMEYEANFGLLSIDWARAQLTMELRGADGSVLQTERIAFATIEAGD